MCKVTPAPTPEQCAGPSLSDDFLDALTVSQLIELAIACAESHFVECTNLNPDCGIENRTEYLQYLLDCFQQYPDIFGWTVWIYLYPHRPSSTCQLLRSTSVPFVRRRPMLPNPVHRCSFIATLGNPAPDGLTDDVILPLGRFPSFYAWSRRLDQLQRPHRLY